MHAQICASHLNCGWTASFNIFMTTSRHIWILCFVPLLFLFLTCSTRRLPFDRRRPPSPPSPAPSRANRAAAWSRCRPSAAWTAGSARSRRGWRRSRPAWRGAGAGRSSCCPWCPSPGGHKRKSQGRLMDDTIHYNSLTIVIWTWAARPVRVVAVCDVWAEEIKRLLLSELT